jgi:hypothetical protein
MQLTIRRMPLSSRGRVHVSRRCRTIAHFASGKNAVKVAGDPGTAVKNLRTLEDLPCTLTIIPFVLLKRWRHDCGGGPSEVLPIS